MLPSYVLVPPSESSGGVVATSDKSQFKVLLDTHTHGHRILCVCVRVYLFVHVDSSVCLCLKLNQVAAGTFG